MENVTAQALNNSLPKDIEYPGRLDIVAPHQFHLLPVDRSIPLDQKFNSILKRVFDLIASAFILVFFFSWVLPLIALWIKLDSKGPVFFVQKRNKRNGKVFTCFKFRTMIINDKADTLPATKNDHRITRSGSFLRKHHLDELPQLFNVLAGHMSMVGPRPYMISDNEKYEKLIRNYPVRHRIKPGITGLAQVVNYVSPVTDTGCMEERIRKDVYYVYNWSPVMDAKIIVRTFYKMIGIKS